MATERMIQALVEQGRDDWVMAADVAWVARDLGSAGSDEEVRVLSVRLITTLLERGLMRIGDVTDGGFFAWHATPEQAIWRVEES